MKVDIKNDEEEMKKITKNSSIGKSEEITPLDVKDSEELKLMIDLKELGENSFKNVSVDLMLQK